MWPDPGRRGGCECSRRKLLDGTAPGRQGRPTVPSELEDRAQDTYGFKRTGFISTVEKDCGCRRPVGVRWGSRRAVGWFAKEQRGQGTRNLQRDPKTHRLPGQVAGNSPAGGRCWRQMKTFKMDLMTQDPGTAKSRLAATSKRQEQQRQGLSLKSPARIWLLGSGLCQGLRFSKAECTPGAEFHTLATSSHVSSEGQRKCSRLTDGGTEAGRSPAIY